MKHYVSVLGLGALAFPTLVALMAFLATGFSPPRVADGNDARWMDSVQSGAESDITPTPLAAHDIALEGCAIEGSAVVNLSDTVGAYIYVLCQAVNLGDHDDHVRITSGGDLINSTLPSGCVASSGLVIPGQPDFVLLAEERKQLLYRIRLECHAPAVPSILALTITVVIDHVVQPDGLDDGNPANDSATLTKNILISPVSPTDTPSPAPVLDTDGDTIPDEIDPDDDNDKVFDSDEGPCGGDSLNGAIQPERLDTPADEDGDTAVNEPLPPASAGFDCDGDGWKGDHEKLVYDDASSTATDQDACGNDGWTADLAGNDNLLNVGDFTSFLFPLRVDGSFNKFGHPVPDPDDNAIARWNLELNATINVGDLNALNPAVLSPTSRPPMFGGQPAFFTNGGLCPWPP